MKTSFHTPVAPALRMAVPSGDVEIDAGPGDTTEITIETPNHDEDRWRIDMSERSGRPFIEINPPGRVRFRSGRATLRISCPEGSDLEFLGGSTDLIARGAVGAARVRSGSGDVDVERAQGPVRVETASGVVRIGDSAQTLDVRGASGELFVGRAHGDVNVTLASGGIRIGHAEGMVRARTSSGDQAVEAMGPGTAWLETVSGDLSVGVVPGTDVWMDMQSVSGDTHSELTPSGEPEEGRPRLEVHMRSVSGDLKLHRAASETTAA